MKIHFLLFIAILSSGLVSYSKVKFKNENEDYKFVKKSVPSEELIIGTFATYTETDWNARLEFQPKGKLIFTMIVQDENMEKPGKNSKNGTWAIEKDLIKINYDKGWVKYEYYPKTKVFFEDKPIDALKPVSSSKDHLLAVQNLTRLEKETKPKK